MVCGRLTVVLLVKPPYHIVPFRRMGVADPVDTHSRFDYLPSSLVVVCGRLTVVFLVKPGMGVADPVDTQSFRLSSV